MNQCSHGRKTESGVEPWPCATIAGASCSTQSLIFGNLDCFWSKTWQKLLQQRISLRSVFYTLFTSAWHASSSLACQETVRALFSFQVVKWYLRYDFAKLLWGCTGPGSFQALLGTHPEPQWEAFPSPPIPTLMQLSIMCTECRHWLHMVTLFHDSLSNPNTWNVQ